MSAASSLGRQREPVTDVGGLPDRLRTVARRHADRTALVSDDESLTYGALLGRVRASVQDLRAHGVGRGDRVALLLENSPEFVIAYLGALAAGAIVVPLNHQYRQLELQGMLDECTPSILVARPESRSLCEAVVAACARPCQVRYTEPWTTFHGSGRGSRVAGGVQSMRTRRSCSSSPPARRADPSRLRAHMRNSCSSWTP